MHRMQKLTLIKLNWNKGFIKTSFFPYMKGISCTSLIPLLPSAVKKYGLHEEKDLYLWAWYRLNALSRRFNKQLYMNKRRNNYDLYKLY